MQASVLLNYSHLWLLASASPHGEVFTALLRSEYLPRRALYLAHPWLLWTNVLLDVFTLLAYMLFFAGICWIVQKTKHIPQVRQYLWLSVAFRLFLLASGASIALRVIGIWLPLYQYSLACKIICAIASIPSALLFAWRVPKVARNLARFFKLLQSEQRQAEALRKSEAFLDRTNRIAGVGGWEVNLLTNQVSWSAETYRIHGAPLDYQPRVEEAMAFYIPECRPVLTAAIDAACAGGEGFDLELSLIRVDGRRIWVRTVGAAEFRDGKAIRLAGAFQDITARVAERSALKEANERVALATDSGGIGIWDWNILEGTVRCDAWMHRLHGMEFSEGVGDELLWREQLHPEDKDAVVQAMQDAIDGSKPYNTEFRVLWPDGTTHNLRATAQVKRDEAGRAVRMVGANWDVTGPRQLTAKLAEQHELLRVTLQSIGDGVITTDAHGKIVWLNPVAERMTGWTAMEAAGLSVVEVFSIFNTETRLLVENPIFDCLKHARVGTLQPDTVLISREGKKFGIEDSAAPILDSNGTLQGAVLVFHDVTEQRRLAAEAGRAARLELRLKDEFLSHVSHELRSPLSSIYSFTSIIADGLAGGTTTDQAEYLEIILKNVVQLQSMIEDLLTVTQAREGKLRIEPQDAPLNDAIIDAVNTVQGAAMRKRVLISSSFDCTRLSAFADPVRLRQILIILLDNAVKFTPAEGAIHIRVSEWDSSMLLVEVADSGCGISAEKRTRVFDKLYQIVGPDALDTSQAGRNGLGLGLHIAKDLVTRQGGTIWVTEAETQGSVFSFTLPRSVESVQHLPTTPTELGRPAYVF